ncbi:GNAT family N-acetyltransferase [Paenibacillus tarimensis]
MRFVNFKSPAAFLDRTADFLEGNEAVNNLLLGLSSLLLQREVQRERITESFFAVEDRGGRLILTILLTDKNLIIYGEGMECETAAQLAAFEIARSGLHVPGVVGPTEISELFAREWASLTNKDAYVKMHQKIYRLDQVNPVRRSSGYIRKAELSDLPVVSEWLYDFSNSILADSITREESTIKMQQFIGDSTLYLWVDQVPVAMAKKARPTKNGTVVTYVYTPPRLRNKGYATSCVASLSQLLLNEGNSFCSLYTDLSNPTSNRIYQQIGYYPIQDSVMYRFKERDL